jgi:hypothetical protein
MECGRVGSWVVGGWVERVVRRLAIRFLCGSIPNSSNVQPLPSPNPTRDWRPISARPFRRFLPPAGQHGTRPSFFLPFPFDLGVLVSPAQVPCRWDVLPRPPWEVEQARSRASEKEELDPGSVLFSWSSVSVDLFPSCHICTPFELVIQICDRLTATMCRGLGAGRYVPMPVHLCNIG